MQERPRYRDTFVRLLGFLRPYKWTLWVSVALALVSQACQFVTAYLTGSAVANAVHGNDRHALDLVVVDASRGHTRLEEEVQERILNDGSRWEVYKRYFEPEALARELGGGRVLHAGRWFVVVQA